MALDQRLSKLLSSIVGLAGDYALARLELSLCAPAAAVPPLLPLPIEPSETALRERWEEIEMRLDEIGRYVKRIRANRGSWLRLDPAFLWLYRTYRELDQHARALRWVLTVTERTTGNES